MALKRVYNFSPGPSPLPLEILKEALFGKFPKSTKFIAAYGFRRMHGRMKKMAREVLQEGIGLLRSGVVTRDEGPEGVYNHNI